MLLIFKVREIYYLVFFLVANVGVRENRHRQIYDMGKPYPRVIRENVLDLYNYILEGIPKIGLFSLRDVSIIP